MDIKTQQPIQGVSVTLHDHPAIATTSDASGHFVLRRTKNFHVFSLGGICSASFPEGKHYRDTIDLTNAGYISLTIRAREYLPPGISNLVDGHYALRDIDLTPVDR